VQVEVSAIMAILEVRKISKDFGGLRVLREVDIDVDRGEILGLIGPNGSGKTTLLNVITGFQEPTGGQLRYKGESILGLKPHQISHRGLARTFQLNKVFPNLTARENVMVARHLRTKGSIVGSVLNTRDYREDEAKLTQKADEILSRVGMGGRGHVTAKNLSHGEQRNLEMAMVLATEPELVLLDEPTSGMNPEEIARVIGLIQSIQQMGLGVVVVEHNMRVVMELCTRIAVLNHGVKIAEGNAEEIIKNDEVAIAYLGRKRNAES